VSNERETTLSIKRDNEKYIHGSAVTASNPHIDRTVQQGDQSDGSMVPGNGAASSGFCHIEKQKESDV
jgi:hypothetical protein